MIYLGAEPWPALKEGLDMGDSKSKYKQILVPVSIRLLSNEGRDLRTSTEVGIKRLFKVRARGGQPEGRIGCSG